jgi:hypothetical protein
MIAAGTIPRRRHRFLRRIKVDIWPDLRACEGTDITNLFSVHSDELMIVSMWTYSNEKKPTLSGRIDLTHMLSTDFD